MNHDSPRAQRAAYDKAKRERMLDDEDPGLRAFMVAMHTGGINNAKGATERATQSMVSYHGTIDRLRRWVGGRAWDRIDPSEIHAYLNRPKADGTPRSPNTVNQNHTALTTFFDFLVDRGFIDGRSPMRHVGRAQVTEESEDFKTSRLPVPHEMWDAVMASNPGMDDLLVLGQAYFAGLRVSEVVIVRPQKVNPLRREMDFWRPKPRRWQIGFGYGAYVDVLKLVHPEWATGADKWLEVMEWMTKYRQEDETLVVSGSVNEPEDWWADRLEHHILPRAGLAPKAFTMHRLRHNFGHNMIECGILPHELKVAMGHKSLETTETYIKNVGQAQSFLERVQVNSAATEAAAEVVNLDGRRKRGR